MALTERAGHAERPGTLMAVPVAAGVRIFDGALVAIDNSGGVNDGRLINWDDSATAVNNLFLGLARVTDATGVSKGEGEAKTGDTAGSVEIDVDTSGVIIRGVIASLILLENQTGDLIYATDENTFTNQVTASGNAIGWVIRFIQASLIDLKLFSADDFRAESDIV